MISNISELYDKYGKKYPYAADTVAYYIFGSNSPDNIIMASYNAKYGERSRVDSYDVSSFMLNYEYSWEENIEYINSYIKNLETCDGAILSDFF